MTAERSPDQDLVVVSGIGVSFNGRNVLNDVDLRLRAGEIITVIGPNGAGKSTLIKIVLGLSRPHRGVVERQPGLKIGYVPQHIEIDATMPLTAERFLRVARNATEESLAQALDEVRAGHLAGRRFHDLSGGEVKRVLLARALLNQPDLLVLDEPTANIDVTGQGEFYDLIRAIRDRRSCGVLLVSHDLHLVMGSTDQVLCLNGHVCCSGAPESVSRHPEYLSLFGDGVTRALGVYSHAHDHTHDLQGETIPGGTPHETPALLPERVDADR